MIVIEEKRGFRWNAIWSQELLLLLCCFIFLFLRVHPILLLESENPVFLNTTSFLTDFLSSPGGSTDWLASLSMQFWLSDVLASLFLACCLWLVSFLTRKWMEQISGGRTIHTLHLIPACILLLAHIQYDFRLSNTLAIIINLLALVLFLRWAPERQSYRAAAGLLMACVLYWLTGGAFFLFAVLCGLNDCLFGGKIISGLFLLLSAALIPFTAVNVIFLVPLQYGYTHNLSLTPPLAGYGLPIFYLASLILLGMQRIAGIQRFLQKTKTFLRLAHLPYLWKVGCGTIIVLGGTFLLTDRYDNTLLKHVFQINSAVREERWADVLDIARMSPYVNPLVSFQTNLALSETGSLLEKMFQYPQNQGTTGLLMDPEWCSAWPEETSNVYWRLGLVSEAQHWCHEALEQKGYTPAILERLATIYMVKDDSGAASRYLLNLKDVPFHSDRAEALLRLNDTPAELSRDSYLGRIRSLKPGIDYISLGHPSTDQLELLLAQDRSNKMAFEYLVANYLLSGNFRIVVSMIPEFASYSYPRLPRYVQEALLFNAAVTPNADPGLVKKWVHPLLYERFGEFRNAYATYRGDKYSARKGMLAQFGDTYWYYLMFVRSAPKKTESQ